MKSLLKFAPLVLALFAISCASIISGTSQNVSINSTPDGAKVVVKTSGGMMVYNGTTPSTCKLQRKNEYIVYITMEGYKEQQVIIDHSFNAWVIGNLICGGVLGLIIDAVDGAMWNLEPEMIRVELITAFRDGKAHRYAVIGALDETGQLRTMAVPLIPDSL